MQFDEDAVQKHFNTWQWLLENFGGIGALRERPLVLPTREFFPFKPSLDHEFAQKTFDRVKELMGMSDWPCELEQYGESNDDHPASKHRMEGEWSSNTPAGLYIEEDDGVVIGYSKAKLEQPGSLVTTFVHELCHYRLRMAARSHPPGGWADHELHTDTACGFLGFGIFAANSVFQFQQWEGGGMVGWRSSSQGYLSESEHAYALALFCKLHGTDPSRVVDHLKKNPRTYFLSAWEDLERRPDSLARLIHASPLPTSLPPILTVETEADAPGYRIADESPAFTQEEVEALGSVKPWYLPLWTFYVRLVTAQRHESWDDKEFAALSALQPTLRDALLAIRLGQRFEDQGLQGAIILDEATGAEPCIQMLSMTIRAYDALGDQPRARFLQALLPAVELHFSELERAERDDTLDEFMSPLDLDDAWMGMDLHWVHELRRVARDKPTCYVHPPSSLTSPAR